MPLHNINPKGSEWGKWDLHVHTPASVLNNEFGDDWDKYVQELFRNAIEKEIVAIGITDYYLIDGYKRVRTDYLDNPSAMNKLFTPTEVEKIARILVIPNIEFRIDKLVIEQKEFKWNRKVNYHLLLSDKIPVSKIERLLNDIKFEGIAAEKRVQTKSLSRENLIELGVELQKSQVEFRDKDPLFVGMMCAAVDTDQVAAALENDLLTFKGKYFFGLPADEDLSGVDWRSGGHLERKNLLIKSDFVLSGNPSTVQFCLGQKHATVEEYIEEFQELKPCVWGSDAHSFDRLFEPDEGRYTWIKAAATFEGLRQVLFEPIDRVRIQRNLPNEKTPYRVIDRVRFLETGTDKRFQTDFIRLSENLNVVIGGKSSGKSLLLHQIAETVDPTQVRDRCGDDATNYQTLTADTDFEVIWKSDEIDRRSADTKYGQITFIPQLYINQLAERDGRQHLRELIESILSQNQDYYEYQQSSEQRVRDIDDQIRNHIHLLLELRDRYRAVREETKLLGTKAQIEAEVQRLTGEIVRLRDLSGFKPEELEAYQRAEAALTVKRGEQQAKTSLLQAARDLAVRLTARSETVLSQIESDFRQTVPPQNGSEELEVLNDGLKSAVRTAFQGFATEISNKITQITNEQVAINENITALEKQLEPFRTKTVNKELLTQRITEHQTQVTKLQLLDQKMAELAALRGQGEGEKKALFSAYGELYKTYKERFQNLQKPEFRIIGDELTLKAELRFDRSRFFDSFTSLFDLRARMKSYFVDRFDDEDQFVFSPDQHEGNIQAIADKLPKVGEDNDLMLKTHTTSQDLYEKLFEDYFEIAYTIEHKGDDMLHMSPGKRGVVLLQLILHLSNADHPILIDQPEDNLDNRTIYNELKGFIREKKEKRQIIIVTHNANLAVSTDSENVIVANQAGQQKGRDKHEFQFEYISGPLENTFRSPQESGILYQLGIREHVCDILEGGEAAFKQREQKYGLA